MSDALTPAEFPIGIVGAGLMGRGIAQIAAAAGFPVRIFDAKSEAVAEARDFVGRMIQRAAEKAQTSQAAADAAVARVLPASTLKDLAGCKLVIEAIIEQIEPKRALFRELEAIVGDDAILASNTSSLSVTAIAAGSRKPDRFAGFHFFNPVPLMKVVEIVTAAQTRADVADTLAAVARRMGHNCAS
jgi:3-hydroxybutyryl-CoA dehydrogenase